MNITELFELLFGLGRSQHRNQHLAFAPKEEAMSDNWHNTIDCRCKGSSVP